AVLQTVRPLDLVRRRIYGAGRAAVHPRSALSDEEKTGASGQAGGAGMNRKLLFIPLILFLLLVAAFMVQLTRNAGGEDPTMLESALIGKPVPTFKLESL